MFRYGLHAIVLFLLLHVTSLHADNPEGALQADLRAFYFRGDRNDRQDREALAVGGILKYETQRYLGFGLGAAFYSSHDLLKRGSGVVPRVKNGVIVDDRSDIGGNSELVQSDGSSIDTLGEAYIQYSSGNTSVRIGRQRLNTPLLNDYYNRFLPNSFEAALLINRDISDTQVTLAIVDRWKYKAEEDFKGIAEGVGLNENLYFAGVENTTFEDIRFALWYYRLSNAFDSLYFSLSHQELLKVGNWKLNGAFQYLKQDDRAKSLIGTLDTYLVGGTLALSDGDFSCHLMVDSVGDDTIRGSGTDYSALGWSKFINFTDIQIDGEALNAGAFSYGMALAYRFSASYKAALKYVHIDQDIKKQLGSYTPNKRADSDEWNIDMTYRTERSGKLRVRIAEIDYADEPLIGNEYDEVNVRLIYDYKFSINQL